MVGSSGVNSVLIGDDFPEFGTDLVACTISRKQVLSWSSRNHILVKLTALTSLHVDDFSHFCFVGGLF